MTLSELENAFVCTTFIGSTRIKKEKKKTPMVPHADCADFRFIKLD